VSDTEQVIPPRRAGVTYTRKHQPAQYESAEASVWVEADLTGHPDTDDGIVAALEAAFFLAKATVLNELGIPYAADEAGVIREVKPEAPVRITPAEVTAAAQRRVEDAFPGTTGVDAGGHDVVQVLKPVAPIPTALQSALNEWATGKGVTKVWDQRNADGTPKKAASGKDQPSFKAVKEQGDHPFWPPRS
jgi:hypothetical protein